MKLFRTCVCCFALIFLLISFGIIAISLYIHLDFAQIMENRIKSEMIIKEENVFYDDWINSKTNERMNFYVFEVENPSEILNGLKPKVREVGPFVFRVERIKEKVSSSFDKTLVSYVERKVYHFIEMMSSGSINDNIIIVNLQFMVLNPMLSKLGQNSNAITSQINNSAINSIFETFASNVFVSKSIREVLFGSDSDPQMDKISQHFSSLSKNGITVPKLLGSQFSMFPNNTQQKFEVFTGFKTGLYGRVLKWNDKSALNVWTGRSCNQINGSHDFQFPPLIDKNDRLYEYSTEMCRSIELSFDEYYESDGIPLYRFSPIDNIFFSPKYNEKNKCFCLFPEMPDKCHFMGILDLSTCTSGAPLILSNPHFRRASEVITKSVVGLSPDEQIHQSFVEIEPITGLVIHRKRRYQFNVHIKKCPLNQNLGKYLKEAIIPMVWFEDISERSDDTKNTIRLLFIYPTQYEELIALSLIGLGGSLMIISLCCCCCCGKNKKIDPISSQENVSGKSIKEMTDQNSDNRIDKTIISHNYDQIFKGQTPLNRLKENPLKRPSTVRQNTAINSSGPPPPPPPPPLSPPPPPPQFISLSNTSNGGTDSRQNLLKDIRKGTKLKKVDKIEENETKRSESIDKITSDDQRIVSQKGPIMLSLAKELEERMRRKSLDNYLSKTGPQSYYRWNNPTNNASLHQRTQFRKPPVPIRRASICNNGRIDSSETIDSDFSDNELETDNNLIDDRLILLNTLNTSQTNFTINRSNSLSFNPNIKTHSIITDIYHFVK